MSGKKFISHFSAAILLGVPNMELIRKPDYIKDGQVEYTVTSRKLRYQKKGHIVHLCTTPLPDGAVIEKDGKLVASPELVFLELASKLSMQELIYLGMQLCSHPAGKPHDTLTTVKKLSNFMKKTAWHRGHRKAMRALKYVADGSASVPETLTYMLLSLPRMLGGYGLKGITCNHEIKLNAEGIKLLGQKRCFVDLFFKSEKVIVEYDSYTHHNTPAQQGKDNIRSQVLESQGYKVFHICTIQLYNNESFNNFVKILASALKRRIRKGTDKFTMMHEQLRSLLNSTSAPASAAV